MLVVVTSAKGSPGVSTAALALAATWPPGQEVAVLECDPSGGDLASGFGLNPEPGLVSLASAARRDHRPGLLWGHTQELPGGLLVAPAPAGAEQATSAVEVFLSSAALDTLHLRGETAAIEAASGEGVVFVDLGRLPTALTSGSGTGRLLAVAEVVLLVARADAGGIVHAAARLDAIRSFTRTGTGSRTGTGGGGGEVRLLLVSSAARRRSRRAGGGGYSAGEVAAALGVSVAGTLPYDTTAAGVLSGHPTHRAGNLGRLPLLRAATAIGHHLATEYARTNAVAPPSRAGDEDPAPRRGAAGTTALSAPRSADTAVAEAKR